MHLALAPRVGYLAEPRCGGSEKSLNGVGLATATIHARLISSPSAEIAAQRLGSPVRTEQTDRHTCMNECVLRGIPASYSTYVSAIP